MSDMDVVPQLLAAAATAERAYNAGFPLVVFARDFVELGVPELAIQIALEAERAPAPQQAEFWYAELARLHGMAGRRDDVERLAAKVEAALGNVHACGTVAVAFEWLGETSRADEYMARVRAPDRALSLAMMIRISARAARLERAEALVTRPELRHTGFRADLAELRLEIVRAYARAGDAIAAKRWLDHAAELLGPPKEYQPNLEIAIAAAELGEIPRALELARAVDVATRDRNHPYSSPESLDLARAFEAAGDTKMVDKILNGYVTFTGRGTTFDLSGAALVRRRFGQTQGVVKLLREAESRLGQADAPDDARSTLARAYAANGQIVRAIEHAAAIEEPDSRAQTLVGIASLVRGRRFEETPALVDALARLGESASP